MVAHTQSYSHPEWSVLQEKSAEDIGRVFAFLIVRDMSAMNKQVPPTQSMLVRCIDLEGAKQTAHQILTREPDVKNIAVLEAGGTSLLGIANRSEIGWQAPVYPAQHLGFH